MSTAVAKAPEPAAETNAQEGGEVEPVVEKPSGAAEVVSLDSFRKK